VLVRLYHRLWSIVPSGIPSLSICQHVERQSSVERRGRSIPHEGSGNYPGVGS
jgi:hypothetical protein